jgi:peptide chain release factor 1
MKIDFQKFEDEKAQIEAFLAQPEAYAAPDFAEKSRRLSEINEILDLAQKIDQAKKNLAEATELVEDAELGEMAREDVRVLGLNIDAWIAELEEKLLPHDPADDKPAIMEIRAGAGGDEASLFAGELYRMYVRYAERHGLKVELLSQNENEAGGIKEVVIRVIGEKPYGQLKFEGGVHRVQRVPVTESQGRIHTSTATVAVLPEAAESDIEIKPEDLRIDIYRSGGHGGQGVNTTDSAVRITHLPTGIMVAMQDERSQQQNRIKAMAVLRSRLMEKKLQEERQAASDARKSLIGSGDRSEKIRTYNFPQDRITDHRVHYSRSNIGAAMDGDIDDLVKELTQAERELPKE